MRTEALLQRLTGHGEKTALVIENDECTYADLVRRVEWWSDYLHAKGVRAPQAVAVIGDYSVDATAILLALAKLGHVAVPLTRENLHEHESMLETACVSTAIYLRGEREWEIRRFPRRRPHAMFAQLGPSAGLVVFTSGSTGERKAALHSFERLLKKFEVKRPALRTLVFLLLDHLGGLNTLLHVLSNGGTAVVLRERTVGAICEAIGRHRVELLPTSPTFIRMMLMSELLDEHDLSSLRLITFGTEPMPQAVLDELRCRLPGVEVKQTYGLTEIGALPAHTRSRGSLWMTFTGGDLEWQVRGGTLWLKSPALMLGYLNASSPFDADGWFDTQDLVEVDGEYLRVLGRSSEIINVGGQKVYPVAVENVLVQMDNVEDAVVFPRKSVVTGQVVGARLALRVPEPRPSVHERVREFCRGRLQPYEVPLWVELVDRVSADPRFKKQRGYGA